MSPRDDAADTPMNIDKDQVRDAARQLALVAGLLTIVLTPALLLLEGTPLQDIQLREFTVVAINVVLGFVLIAAARLMEKNPLTSAVLSFVAAVALLYQGGTAGLIGGLFGLASAFLAAIPISVDILEG